MEPSADESLSQRNLAMFAELSRMSEAVKNRMSSVPKREDNHEQRRQHASAQGANKTVKASGTFFPQAGKPDGKLSFLLDVASLFECCLSL